MAGETNITVVGNLVADPELRHTQNGVAVTNFTIASTPTVFDKATNGYKDGDSLFLKSTVWKDQAEHVARSLVKGSRVVASGRLRQKSYVTKDGESRTVFEFEVDEVGASLRFTDIERSSPPGKDSLGSSGAENKFPGTNISSNNAGHSMGQESNTSSDSWASDETPF